MAGQNQHAVVAEGQSRPVRAPASRSPRRRWIVTAGILLVAVAAPAIGLLTYGLYGPESPIVVSPETTLLTEPLAADGLPDYARHSLALAGRGTPPAANAAVPLLEAFWPMDLDEDDLAAVCSALDIERPGQPLVGFEGDNFFFDDEIRAGIESVLEAAGTGPLQAESVSDVIDTAAVYPWRSADLPSLAAWLTRNNDGLELVVAASTRPRLFLPAPALVAGERGRLLFDTPPPLQPIRSGSRGLILRSMQRLGDGRFADAWSDILAVHRLARLAPKADAGSLIGHLMATALSATACPATLRLLDAPGLPADFRAAVCRDLESLPPLPEPRHGIVTERLGMLDFMIHVCQMPREERAEVLSVLECKDPAVERTFATSLDCNAVLATTVADYARLDAALAHPSWAERQQALDRLGREVTAAVAPPTGGFREGLHAFAMLSSRRGRSERIPRVFSSNWVPAVRAGDAAITRGQAGFELTRIAAALAAWRAGDAAGGYPERLDQLVPRYVDRLPLDPFTDQPFRYERRADGYLLVSVGQDGRDDGGTDLVQPIVGGEWVSDWTPPEQATGTDIVVRLPMPASPVLARIRKAKAPGR